MTSEENARGDLAGVKVLVVEDEAVVAFDLEYTLGDYGCAVLGPVASAADALAALRGERPDVVLLDVSLLDGTSTEVARTLVGMGVPYVVASGYDNHQLEVALLRDAPQLAKPYQAEALCVALKRVLGRDAG